MNQIQREHGRTAVPSFSDVLKKMNHAGGFSMAVLATEEGLPVATDPQLNDQDQISALTALVHQACRETGAQLGFSPVDEICLRDTSHSLLICRPIQVGDQRILLGVQVPSGCAYRRITNQAVREIRQLVLQDR